MMIRVAPMEGCGVGRIIILLRQFLFYSMVFLFVGMSSSCTGRHYPRPDAWPAHGLASGAACGSIEGVYRDQGSSSCEWLPPGFRSLSYILEPYLFYDFFPVRHLGTVGRVEIWKSGEDRLEVFMYDTQDNLLYLSPEKGLEYTCRPDGAMLSYKPRIDPREGVSVVSGNLFLSRGEDGSLICRVTEHRLFCSFIIPAPLLSTTYTLWYRFETQEDAAVKDKAAGAAEHDKQRNPGDSRVPGAGDKGTGGKKT